MALIFRQNCFQESLPGDFIKAKTRELPFIQNVNKHMFHVQFWKIIYCRWIMIFFSPFFLANPDWKYFQNNTCKNRHFTSPCNDFIGPSHFADASCHWAKCIWALSPRLSSLVLGKACLDQVLVYFSCGTVMLTFLTIIFVLLWFYVF